MRNISPEERVRLIRRANELYNAGDIEQAKRVFVATDYTDGMIRVADYYYKQERPVDALFLYRKAGCVEQVEELYERIAGVIRILLHEDELQKDREAFFNSGK